MTIYLGITPDYTPEAGQIMDLFFSQLIYLNTKTLPEQDRSHEETALAELTQSLYDKEDIPDFF